jgi:hypothetical protein
MGGVKIARDKIFVRTGKVKGRFEMKKKINVTFAAMAAFALCTAFIMVMAGGCNNPTSPEYNNETPVTPTGSTFIRFENRSTFPVRIYTSTTARDGNETPFRSVDVNGTSDDLAYPAGNGVFYITYLLSVDGIAIPYAPAGEAGYVYGRVDANKTTTIPIPPLSEKLSEQEMAGPLTD